MVLLHKVIQKIRQCNCLITVIAPGWPGMPWFWDLVQLSTEIPLQLPVSRTLLKQSHNYVFHSNPQHLNLHAWCLGEDSSKNKASLEVAERIAAPQRSSTRTIYKSKWAVFEKWCRENSVDFSTPSVKQVSDFFMYLYQDLNRRPSTIDGYRTTSTFLKALTVTGYFPPFIGIVKVENFCFFFFFFFLSHCASYRIQHNTITIAIMNTLP